MLSKVNCSSIFSPMITDSGVCCAFNLNLALKESTYSKLVAEMKVAVTFIFPQYKCTISKLLKAKAGAHPLDGIQQRKATPGLAYCCAIFLCCLGGEI